jgi:hypothetical protein
MEVYKKEVSFYLARVNNVFYFGRARREIVIASNKSSTEVREFLQAKFLQVRNFIRIANDHHAINSDQYEKYMYID